MKQIFPRFFNLWPEILVSLILLSHCLIIVSALYEPMTYAVNDGPYYISIGLSIKNDGDLALENQLPGSLHKHKHQIALGKNGTWYPKHPVLFSLGMVPFLWIFGFKGALIFNILIILIWGILLTRLVRKFTTDLSAFLAVAAIWFTTYLPSYVYDVNADFLPTWLMFCVMLAFMSTQPVLAGFFWGVSLWAKLVNVLFAPVIALLLAKPFGVNRTVKFAVGLILPLLIILGLNTHMFGGPLTNGYDRILTVSPNGDEYTYSQKQDFDVPYGHGLKRLLISPRMGLVRYAWIVFISLPGLLMFRREQRKYAWMIIYVYISFLLFFAPYSGVRFCNYGNRFMIFPVSLSAIPTALILEKLMSICFKQKLQH